MYENIPSHWRVAHLSEVSDISFSSVDKKTVDGETSVRLCNYKDVYYNRLIKPDMAFMSATATIKERSKWSLKKDDVLFTKDSESAEDIGVPALVTEDMPNVLCGYHLGLARPFTDVIEGGYLARLLNSDMLKKEFARIANGVTRFGLTLQDTCLIPITVPPLDEQRYIVYILDSIENLIDVVIEEQGQMVIKVEQIRDALIHKLITQGISTNIDKYDWILENV